MGAKWVSVDFKESGEGAGGGRNSPLRCLKPMGSEEKCYCEVVSYHGW